MADVTSCEKALYTAISIHQISGKLFSRVLIGSHNSECPRIFVVLGRDSTVSKDEILAVNEQLQQQMPRKRQNLAFRCLPVGRKNFLTEFTTKS